MIDCFWSHLEQRIVFCEKQYKGYSTNKDYTACQQKVDLIYEIQTKGTKIGGKYDWYQNDEKFIKFSINLGKNALSKVSSDQLH